MRPRPGGYRLPVRRCLRVLGLAAAFAATSGARSEEIQVASAETILPESESVLAEIAQPMRIVLPADSDPIQAARSLCGELSDTFMGLLAQANPGRPLSPSAESSPLVVPACFVRGRPMKAQPDGSETLGSFLERTTGAANVDLALDLLRQNRGLGQRFGTRQFDQQEFAQLRDKPIALERALVLPFVPREASYELRANQNGEEAVERLRRTLDGEGEAEIDDAPLTLESEIDPALSRAVPCSDPLPIEDQQWPFDRAGLIATLQANDIYRATHDLDPIRAASIAVADNGVDGMFDLFPRALFESTIDIDGNQRDEDRNGFVDDAPGINLYSRRAPVSLATNDRWHGTHLARLALGGPGFTDSLAAAGVQPRVRLIAISLVRSETPPFTNEPTFSLPPDAVEVALNYARGRGVRVINLSVSTSSRMGTVAQRLSQPGTTLMVVAAGNSATSYETRWRYPASFGGVPDPDLPMPVLTVAAHDKRGCLADFSGRGARDVDLAAPGVGIESADRDGTLRTANGTSQATALVSFAAGLLAAEGLSDPLAIKLRLIASVTPRSDLEEHVFAGGMLNIVNAVQIYHDLLQLRGQPEAARIELAGQPTIRTFCPNAATDDGSVLKVSSTSATGPLRVLVRWSNRNLVILRCTPHPEARIRYRQAGTEMEAPVSHIADFVPRL